jgi:HD-GYP domain-containing protein (c-di-GMP phosphodiesterase class II)
MDEQLIRRVPLFSTLPQSEITYLDETLPRVIIPKGTVIIHEGSSGNQFYVLLEGQVEIFKSLTKPAERSLGLRQEGAFLGEMSLFNLEGRHTASVVAITELRVLQLIREDFNALLIRNPTLAYTMTRLLSQRLEESDNQATQELLEKNRQLTQAYDATIEGWSRAMEIRDEETEGHLERVRDLTIELAKAVGMNADELANIRRGALLHDIGKLGVPDGILLKTGKLTEEEFMVMRKHPQMAYDMLFPIEYIRPSIDIPYCHHEKWDGTGYPRGLKGKDIPFAARLFAVIDVWDALRSNRPYRSSLPEEKVISHLRFKAGTQFDPEAVELFIQMICKNHPEKAELWSQLPPLPCD